MAKPILDSITTANIPSGHNYQGIQEVELPQGIVGNITSYVEADADSQIFEFNGELTAETNNLSAVSDPITVYLSPWPNLQVTQIDVPGNATAGSTFPLTYRIQNSGTVPTSVPSWTDRVYYSTSDVWNINDATLLASYSRART